MNKTFMPRLHHDAASLQTRMETVGLHEERGIMASYASWQSYQYFTRLKPHAVASLNTSCTDSVATLDGSLVALLDLRASQINGCLLCVQYHLCRARKAGVTAVKVENIGAWRWAGVFSPCEKVVLAWAEHLAGVVRHSAPDWVWPSLKGHFSDMQIAALFMYWNCSELWSGNDVLRCCTAGMPVSVGPASGSPA
jgi:AhpD family alkylhydroperoxidase